MSTQFLFGVLKGSGGTERVAIIEIDGHNVTTVNSAGKIGHWRDDAITVLGSLPDDWMAGRDLKKPDPAGTYSVAEDPRR